MFFCFFLLPFRNQVENTILRNTFDGWNSDVEFLSNAKKTTTATLFMTCIMHDIQFKK